MSNGLKITNPTGNIMLSDKTSTAVYVGKATLQSQGGYGSCGFSRAVYRISGCHQFPLPFIYSASDEFSFEYINCVDAVNGVWDMAFFVTPTPVSLTVYVFTAMAAQPLPTETYGLKTYNDQGALTFHTDYSKFLNVRGLMSSISGGANPHGVPGLSKAAIMPATGEIFNDSTSGGAVGVTLCGGYLGFRADSTNIHWYNHDVLGPYTSGTPLNNVVFPIIDGADYD